MLNDMDMEGYESGKGSMNHENWYRLSYNVGNKRIWVDPTAKINSNQSKLGEL